MGLLNIFTKDKAPAPSRPALEAAQDSGLDEGAIGKLVQTLLSAGLDGAGPLKSSQAHAHAARAKAGSTEAAVNRVRRHAVGSGAVGGFVTGLGGFLTMPVALPANLVEFYVQATRMVGAIATLRGYDVKDPNIRTAVLLTLVGSNADDVLKKAGIATGGGRLASVALRQLPPVALMLVNKAVGFRLLRSAGTKVLGKLGRGVPVIGGFVGGGLDAYMMGRIAQQAEQEFPPFAAAAS